MSGYYGYSMSNNAHECYESGIMPMSRWTKSAILEAIDSIDPVKAEQFKKLRKDELQALLVYDSWHHTSNRYNKTDFYVISEDLVLKATVDSLRKEHSAEAKKEDPTELWSAEVQIWSGTRKHPRFMGTEVVAGIRKGDWLVCDDGHRYKLSANKTLKYWKEEK